MASCLICFRMYLSNSSASQSLHKKLSWNKTKRGESEREVKFFDDTGMGRSLIIVVESAVVVVNSKLCIIFSQIQNIKIYVGYIPSVVGYSYRLGLWNRTFTFLYFSGYSIWTWTCTCSLPLVLASQNTLKGEKRLLDFYS